VCLLLGGSEEAEGDGNSFDGVCRAKKSLYFLEASRGA